MNIFPHWLFTIFTLLVFLPTLSADPLQFVSTESDPDAFIHNSVNVINGDYCESATDLVITGPDALVLQRFYSTKDVITGIQAGGWRILPQRFLVIGKDSTEKSCNVGKDRFEWSSAFVGERSGGILPYNGWRNTNGSTKDPLKIDLFNNALGLVNTYAQEINGQNNHQNNLLNCKGTTCELILGDGTKRIYQKVQHLPSSILGEELTPLMAQQIVKPEFFLLSQEILPSGNHIFFFYDADGHLISIEMKNKSLTKVFSWIRLRYEYEKTGCQVHIQTSDERKLTYHLTLMNGNYQLIHVEGSHCKPIAYEYKDVLIKKTLPEGRFLEIDYQDGKVKSLKGPNSQTGKAEITYSFTYGADYTDVFNNMGIKTSYIYDKRFQLTAIQRYDEQNCLYRIEQKFWGKAKSDAGLLLAKTIEDGSARIYSYRSFHYDKAGNVTEERLYGNLTGKEEVSLQISSDGNLLNPDEEECNIKTFSYSTDGLNLLTGMGDCKGNQTLYTYKSGTNLLIRKLIFDKMKIRKRTFQSYNEDGVCIKIIEDDAMSEDESKIFLWWATERHIKEIKPKETLPGVGLPEVISEKALDGKKNQEILIKKFVNTYDSQSNLLSCTTYDANGQYAFTESRTYNTVGQVISQIDAAGRESLFGYDGVGNQISTSIPQDGKYITTTFDFHNQPILITEITAENQFSIINIYDSLGRKICSTDRYGNSTDFEYDAFNRLLKVIHPEVSDENSQIIRPTFSYTYDLFGNVLRAKDPRGDIIEKSYNLRGDATRISYPDGTFELFKYDTEGSLHRSLTRDQIITVYEYDYLGRIIYEEVSAAGETGVSSYLTSRLRKYNGFRCTFQKDGNHVQHYTFDPSGRLISLIENGCEFSEKTPDAHITEIFYDALGRVQKKRVWFDSGSHDYALECFEYDLSGNVLEKRIEDAQGSILLRKFFSYNPQGHCTEEYTIENNTKTTLIRTFYNSEGEPVGYLDAFGQETKIIIDNSYQNSLGQTVLKKTLVNPIGVQTEIEFDALSRVYSITKKDPFGVLLSSERTLYDSLGNKACEVHDRILDGKLIGSQKMQWIYGPMGRLEEEVDISDSQLENRTRYSYNSLGKMTSKCFSGSATPINYTYNKKGWLHKIEAQNSKKELQISNSYSYDCKGNILAAQSLHEKLVERTYNAFNQVTKEEITDGEGYYTLQYSYDKKGRLKKVILPDNSKISYTYDAIFGREVNRISARGDILYTHTYDQYDSQGRLQNENCIGYTGSKEHTYDLNGRKISSKNEYFSEQYVRDSLGRLIEVKGNMHDEYLYNSLSQLTSEKRTDTKTYLYDSLDNRIKAGNNELTYNSQNQLTSYSNAEFSYDTHGNLLRKVLDGDEIRFESNILSQVISIEKADQTALTFSYDPFGRLLVEKHVDMKSKNKKALTTLRYFYLDNQEIGTLSRAGNIETLKIPGLQGDELAVTSVAFEIKGDTYVPLHDIGGNVVSLIHPQSREIIESYQYTAFGEGTIYNSFGDVEEDSLVGNPWRFAEKRFDQESSLVLFGLRFYDPTTGRWISQDPAGYIDGPNLYAYLHNNPLNHLDRFGLATEANSQNKFEGYFYGEVESHCYCEKHRTCKRGGDIGITASSSLPKITYNDYFEKYFKDFHSQDLFIKDCYPNSTCYDLSGDGLPNLPNDMGIGFTNGIWNDFVGSKESTQYLSRLSGGYNIHAVHNATHGNGVDILECVLGLNYIATDPVRQLHIMWNSFFEKSSANAKLLMICHSQGALHVRNALLDYPPELRDRILVVAIAPAGYVYKETCANVIHYRAEAWRDFVPRLDRAGASREKDSIVTLSSLPDAAAYDHEFMSPTYQEKLQFHINRYIKSQGKTL